MKAKITVNKNFKIGEIDKRIYGSFIEHIGRAVYNGLYEPTHPTANKDGFREDVLDLVRAIDVPIVRYPGGNFVSGYKWEDGTGPKSERPRRVDLAWKAIETNQFGTDEFQEWCRQANSEVLMAVNLGTRGPQEACDLVEYCNADTDTYFANKRRANGFDKPFGIKTWCLGNEMDGPWQIGAKTAEEYGRTACEAGKMMKWIDPSIELVACGSSYYGMKTFGDWELTVLDHTYNVADYISLHQYYNNRSNNTPDFLGRTVQMNEFIKSVVALCDAVKAKKHSKKTINLSFDEWNVWYHSDAKNRTIKDWEIAPPYNEDIYNFEDALLVGSMLITLQNNCDRVKIACLAQLVNVIAPIMTENGGAAWVQPIFYPYLYAAQNGRGETLRAIVDSESYRTTDGLDVPYVDASVIVNEDKREMILFAVNRSLDSDIELDLDLGGFDSARPVEHIELWCEDLKAVNSATEQTVSPTKKAVSDTVGSAQTVSLKRQSWNMVKFKY